MVFFSIFIIISQNWETAPESLFFREKPRPGEIEILVSENPSSVTEARKWAEPTRIRGVQGGLYVGRRDMCEIPIGSDDRDGWKWCETLLEWLHNRKTRRFWWTKVWKRSQIFHESDAPIEQIKWKFVYNAAKWALHEPDLKKIHWLVKWRVVSRPIFLKNRFVGGVADTK